jgi:hypothetical protein
MVWKGKRGLMLDLPSTEHLQPPPAHYLGSTMNVVGWE